MAEYIDRAEVLELKQDYGEGQYSMILIDPVLVKKLSTADVIERSKINKAIKEIESWINSNNRGNADYFIVDKIEEIIKDLKKNIGE